MSWLLWQEHVTYAYSLTQASFGFAEILGPSVGGLMFQVGVDQAENFTRHLRFFLHYFLYIYCSHDLSFIVFYASNFSMVDLLFRLNLAVSSAWV
jgi:hypothetical protein